MPMWLEVIVRTLVAVIVLFVLTRLLGKRQISQLSFFEYITGITIGSITAYISLDVNTDWYLGLIAVTVWFLVSLGIEYLQIKSKKARDWIDSSSTVLIKDGKILEDNLKKERLTNEELMEQLRKKSIFKVAEVEFAVIEPDGQINAMLKNEYQPITPSHLGIKVAPEPEPQTVIIDGKIMDEPLATLGLNRKWLNTELEKLGVSLDNVNLGQVDAYGQFYADLYDDQITVPQPQEKAVLLAQLKKCEADLEMFALSTDEEAAKKLYGDCSANLQQVIDQVKPLLIQ
ncbi:DUF421 domain-containing protein [Paenibacillus timonensis]|uniref:DUF421 domain-containing protein n=1 Tax=Paenibacillus timonensis TaxID=225915 RepID=A0ABW3SBH0_9BACL|nr:DUF421 domain-containing protein [Paenibacillus timonensis]MCH1640627.1 DUF421 domain-containing protein [Paenibacillus timonensis]GJM80870.1 hypothetical protein HMSSN139_33660 [Paenibacillus sp. HMSSN-139]